MVIPHALNYGNTYKQDQTLKNDIISWRIKHHYPKMYSILYEKEGLY
jgi:hypothetical protein